MGSFFVVLQQAGRRCVVILFFTGWVSSGVEAAGDLVRNDRRNGLIQQGDTLLFRVELDRISVAREAVENLVYRYLGAEKRDLVIEEKIQSRQGKLKSYSIRQNQTGLVGSMSVTGNEVVYTKSQNGHTATRRVTASLDLPYVAGPQIGEFLRTHAEELKKNKKIRFLLPVLERSESIEFEIERRDEIVHEMRPASGIYQLFVRKVLIELDPRTGRIHQIHGRILPLVQRGSSWESAEATTIYQGA